MTTRRILVGIVAALSFIPAVLAGTLPTRPWATATITTIATPRLQNITNYIGGNQSTTVGPNFGAIIFNAVASYSDSMGMIVYVIFFALPFLMMWIVQADMAMPAIVGMFFSLYVFAKMPEQYILFAVGCFVICGAALSWSLYRRAY